MIVDGSAVAARAAAGSDRAAMQANATSKPRRARRSQPEPSWHLPATASPLHPMDVASSIQILTGYGIGTRAYLGMRQMEYPKLKWAFPELLNPSFDPMGSRLIRGSTHPRSGFMLTDLQELCRRSIDRSTQAPSTGGQDTPSGVRRQVRATRARARGEGRGAAGRPRRGDTECLPGRAPDGRDRPGA